MDGNTALTLKRGSGAEQTSVNRPPLTPRERQILTALKDFRAANGYGASFRELAAQIPCALATVAVDMRSLRNKGYIRQPAGITRAAVPVDEDGAA